MFDKFKVWLNLHMLLLPLYIEMVWGFLIFFSLVGTLYPGGYLPIVSMMIICLGWCATRIIRDAYVAYESVRTIFTIKKSNDDT
jgi:hypothetical protein